MNNDFIQQLEELTRLKDSKEISESEYEVRKTKILTKVAEEEKLNLESDKRIENERIIEKNKKIAKANKASGCFMWVMVIFLAGIFISLCSSPKTNTTTSTYSATDVRPTDDNSTILYKAYLRAERALKSSLHDADSYEEVSNDRYFLDQSKKKNKGKYIQIKIEYRAKNGFGAYRLNTMYFNFDKDLNLIENF